MTPDRWLTVREAAAHAGVCSGSIYKAVRTRQLRHTRIGGRRTLKFQAAWIDAWLAEGTVEPQPDTHAEAIRGLHYS